MQYLEQHGSLTQQKLMKHLKTQLKTYYLFHETKKGLYINLILYRKPFVIAVVQNLKNMLKNHNSKTIKNREIHKVFADTSGDN